MEFTTDAEMKKLMADRKSAFAPQTRWKYSNLAYAVAGLLVAWTGSGWPDLLIGAVIGLLVLNGARRILQLRA